MKFTLHFTLLAFFISAFCFWDNDALAQCINWSASAQVISASTCAGNGSFSVNISGPDANNLTTGATTDSIIITAGGNKYSALMQDRDGMEQSTGWQQSRVFTSGI